MSVWNDDDLRVALNDTPAILPRSLWHHLDNIAQYLALVGATDEALEVWKFAYSGLVMVPEQTYLGDCCVTAVCRALGHRDISQANPLCEITRETDTLEKRVSVLDKDQRRLLPNDCWQPDYRDEIVETARRAFQLARPSRKERFSPTEAQALPVLDEFFALPSSTQWHAIMMSHLLYADIAARHQASKVNVHLQLWAQMAEARFQMQESVFALYTTAALVCRGALASISKIPPAERCALTDSMLQELRARLLDPNQEQTAPAQVESSIFYSTLSFEPASDEIYESQWEQACEDCSPAPPADELYPAVVSITTPDNSGDCVIEAEYAEQMPPFDECDYAVAFPLCVMPNERANTPDGRVGTVFPTTPTGDKEDYGLEVAPGEYDVLARFFSIAGEGDDIGLRSWRVVLSFLPRGSLKLGLVKDEAN